MANITRINYSIRNNGGGSIILPGQVPKGLANLKVPDQDSLWAPAADQSYAIGTQLRLNGNLYRYCKAGETIAIGHQGFLKCARTICPGAVGGGGSEAALYEDAVAGQDYLVLTDTGSRAAHYYEDGALWVLNDTTGHYNEYRIVDNDVYVSASYLKVYIDPPLRFAHSTTAGTIQAYRSPYIDVRSMLTSGNQSWFSAIGMARFPITTAYFFWLQTAGRCWGTGASTWPGQTAYQRTVMANTDGSLIGLAAATTYYQTVGYLLSGTTSIYGDVFFMLQLDQ